MEAQVTVLFPVKAYHRPYLERAVLCILGQTSPRGRLLVIDDGAAGREFDEAIAPALADERTRLIASRGRGLAARSTPAYGARPRTSWRSVRRRPLDRGRGRDLDLLHRALARGARS